VLVDQPPPDPLRRVTLLARRLAIRFKARVDDRPIRASFGVGRPTGERFTGGTGDANACLTARRCAPCRSASARIDNPSRSRSRLICSNNSTLDPIPSGASRSSLMKLEP
jgi:hypothetical protein